jgi:hypothetical protein
VVALRVVDGLVVERLWHLSDEATFWRHLGYVRFVEPESLPWQDHSTGTSHSSKRPALQEEEISDQACTDGRPNSVLTAGAPTLRLHPRPWQKSKSKPIGGRYA